MSVLSFATFLLVDEVAKPQELAGERAALGHAPQPIVEQPRVVQPLARTASLEPQQQDGVVTRDASDRSEEEIEDSQIDLLFEYQGDRSYEEMASLLDPLAVPDNSLNDQLDPDEVGESHNGGYSFRQTDPQPGIRFKSELILPITVEASQNPSGDGRNDSTALGHVQAQTNAQHTCIYCGKV